MSERCINDPREVVKPGQVVKVKVLKVNVPRNRIGLTLRLSDPIPAPGERRGGGVGNAKLVDRYKPKPEPSSGGGARQSGGEGTRQGAVKAVDVSLTVN
jgi:uncharacterized protein